MHTNLRCSTFLYKSANELVRNKIHPTSIISGYKLAMREACKYVEEKLSVKVDKLGKDSLVNCAKTSISSKLIHSDRDFFANLISSYGHVYFSVADLERNKQRTF
ncbi:hypothetical protein ZWY2020_049127 [Hordeum vulgare]|nr:hypothetical protein ZWY2020_049127 [Hordeum vulgare]